jgi:hypothetical protein
MKRLILSVTVILLISALVLFSGCPSKRKLQKAINASLPVGTIGTLYNGSPPSTSNGWRLTNVVPTANSWLTYNATTGALVGTPKGNDFGEWPVVLSYKKGNKTADLTVIVVVGTPTGLSFTPTTGFAIPFHAQHTVNINITPAETYNFTHTWKLTTSGQAKVVFIGSTTDINGDGKIIADWQLGGDFKGELTVKLKSNAPAGKTHNFPIIPATSR